MLFGVPTVYARMLRHVKDPVPLGYSGPKSAADPSWFVSQEDMTHLRGDINAALAQMRTHRVHSCGSAALPEPVMHAWHRLCGQVLLERFGMTELGMVSLSTLFDESFVGFFISYYYFFFSIETIA